MKNRRILALFLMEFAIMGSAIEFALLFAPTVLSYALWTSFMTNATLTVAMYLIDKRESHAKL